MYSLRTVIDNQILSIRNAYKKKGKIYVQIKHHRNAK